MIYVIYASVDCYLFSSVRDEGDPNTKRWYYLQVASGGAFSLSCVRLGRVLAIKKMCEVFSFKDCLIFILIECNVRSLHMI